MAETKIDSSRESYSNRFLLLFAGRHKTLKELDNKVLEKASNANELLRRIAPKANLGQSCSQGLPAH